MTKYCTCGKVAKPNIYYAKPGHIKYDNSDDMGMVVKVICGYDCAEIPVNSDDMLLVAYSHVKAVFAPDGLGAKMVATSFRYTIDSSGGMAGEMTVGLDE